MKTEIDPSPAADSNITHAAYDTELLNKIKIGIAIPAPHKGPFWQLEAIGNHEKEKKKIFGLFKKPSLNEDLVKELRTEVTRSPGSTQQRINKLRKKYPGNSLLVLFSGICTYGDALNASNKEEAFFGFQKAVKEAATAIFNGQVSLFSMEIFFKIYFAYLDRFKRFQVSVYEEMVKEPRLDGYRRDFLNAIQITDQLISERSGIQIVINQLKKRMMSSQYNTTIDFMLIREAAQQIVSGNPSQKCRLGSASETIAFIHAITSTFARIPLLFESVDQLLLQFPELHKSFQIRKIAINSIRNFVRFRMAVAEGDREQMIKIANTIFKENSAAISNLEGQSLNQPYETDPFFNIAYLAQLSQGTFSDSNYQDLLDAAVKAMDEVISRDMSKGHVFTEAASTLANKLNLLKNPSSAESDSP